MITFAGVYTAIVTPFANGKLDLASLERLLETQIAGGIAGVVPVGTTGESPTLTHEEHMEVFRQTIRIVAGRCKVFAGTGSNCTAEAIEMTREAEQMGADGALIVAPYYNKPTQEGVFRHYAAIAEKVRFPIILYSIPGRCGIEISVSTTCRIAEACPNIRCIKEAGGSVERVNQLRAALPEDFAILSGDDSLTLPFLSAGATGVISVASNLIPAEMSDLVRSWAEGDTARAAALHRAYYPLFRDIFIESNPVPIKYTLCKKGIIASPEVRLPLVELSPESRNQLDITLEKTLP